MPRLSDDEFTALVQEFRDVLNDCRQLFRDCAREYVQKNPELLQGSPEEFTARMVELHRGLLLKVFVEMIQADQKVSGAEVELARELFAHCWGQQLDKDQAREALQHYNQTTLLRWDSLLWPFERLSSFRARAGECRSIIQQMCHLVAQVNGKVDRRSTQQARWIQTAMTNVMQRVPLAEAPAPPGRKSAVAVEGDFEVVPETAQAKAGGKVTRQFRAVELLDDVLAELDALIGLASIKQEVKELVHFLTIQDERRRHDLPTTPISLHAVFTGNPGTGKTTVARLLGRILGAMGILARGHLIETDRSGLVAEYAGQTAPKTNQRINEALDGVLFIDEAYSLVAEKGDDPYGAEALQSLLKRMEDDRNRLVVVLAGYPQPMDRLLKTNPGLSSRFQRTFAFPDYTAVELGQIFQTMCARDHYQLPGPTRAKLLVGFQYLLDHRDEHFGNGRLARNVFERSLRRQSSRLAGLANRTRELLTTLQPEDIVMEGIPVAVWESLKNPEQFFRVSCPGCGQVSRARPELLGRQVHCPQCGNEFPADWGEVAE